jgi:hypothetical protein
LYRIDDRGNVPCPNGDPGRAMHLSSRNDDPRHQLSDVIVDVKLLRFCSVRLTLDGGALSNQTYWEGHYATVGPYWMLTDALVASTPAGIGVRQQVWRYKLVDMRFPDTLPASVFERSQ